MADAWWLARGDFPRWSDFDSDDRVAQALADLLNGQSVAASPALRFHDEITLLSELSERERRDHLRDLWHAHERAESPSLRVGLPPPLWANLHWHLGRTEVAATWLPEASREEIQGRRIGSANEWWNRPGAPPGVTYHQRLWGWGVVEGAPSASGDHLAWSGRHAWSAAEGAWAVSRGVSAALVGLPFAPLVARGPGFLLAALLEATTTLWAPTTGPPRRNAARIA